MTLHRLHRLIGRYFTQLKAYPTNPKTIHDAIHKRRLDLNLRQIDLSKIFSRNELTIVNWEKVHRTARLNHTPLSRIGVILACTFAAAGAVVKTFLLIPRRKLAEI